MTRAYPACLGSDDDPVQTFIARQLFFDGPRRPKSQVLWACAESIHEIRLAADSGPDQEQTPHISLTVWNHHVFSANDSALLVGSGRKRPCCLTFSDSLTAFVNGDFRHPSKGRTQMGPGFCEERCPAPATTNRALRRADSPPNHAASRFRSMRRAAFEGPCSSLGGDAQHHGIRHREHPEPCLAERLEQPTVFHLRRKMGTKLVDPQPDNTAGASHSTRSRDRARNLRTSAPRSPDGKRGFSLAQGQ